MRTALIGAALLAGGVAVADRVMIEPDDELAEPRSRFPAPLPISPDIATLGYKLAGTYTCGPVRENNNDKLVVSVGLDNAWIEYRFAHAVEYRSYDQVAKQWTRIRLASDGTTVTFTSLGVDADGAWTWTADTRNEREVFEAKGFALGQLRCGRL